jgi:predicted Zn-dependent peptidase
MEISVKHKTLIPALLLLAAAIPVFSALPVKEHVLDNGMRFLIIEDHTSPNFIGAWVAHVGSANERPGITGLTHLLEHMMFKGTDTIGTTDLERDLALIEEQESVKESMRQMDRELRWQVRRGEFKTLAEAREGREDYAKLNDKFATLVEEQRETMIPNEFDQIMQKNGEIFGNAFTMEDMTAYFNVLPANRLELWFWLESDRLINPVFREFYAERSVVREERRMRTEASPTGVHEEALNSMFWQAHPYSWPVIGWESDVEQLSMQQARDYYRTWYGPSNVSCILAGDFETKDVIDFAERYFGRMEPRPAPPALVTLEPHQQGEKRYFGEADVNNSVKMRYHCGGFKHVDSGVLNVLASVLNGDTGRLQRRLVQDQKLAIQAWAYYEAGKYGGSFIIEAEAAEGIDHGMLEDALTLELDLLSGEAIPERELQKVKNNNLVNAYRKEESSINAAFTLIHAEGMGDWRESEVLGERIQATSSDDLMRVATQVFVDDNRLVAWWSRPLDDEGMGVTTGAFELPENFDSLPEEMQAMAKQFLQRVSMMRDLNQLDGILMQMNAGAAEAPADEQFMTDLLKSEVIKRIEILSASEGDTK